MGKKRKRKDRQQRLQKQKKQVKQKRVARGSTARPQPAPVEEDRPMNTPQLSFDEWRRLYQAAIAFKQVAPWKWMTETDVFGVQNPESGQIGYGSIMGMLGEHLALAVYLGSEGLEGFWRIEEGRDVEPTFVLEVPQLQASWEDREALRREDREVIKALGLKFRVRGAWPLFRSYVPGYFPWFVTPEEARFLTLALEQGLEVVQRVKEDRALLSPLREGVYLVRTPEKQGETLVWKDEWVEPPPPQPRPLPPPAITETDLAALRQLPRQKMVVQADLFLMPSPIKEKEDPRPYFPYNLMAVESRSGLILGTDILAPKPSLDVVWAKAPEAFLSVLRRLGSLPTEVAVRSERVYELLKPVAAGLDIRLTRKRSLPALEQARATLEQWMIR
jgi:hypothetical protein